MKTNALFVLLASTMPVAAGCSSSYPAELVGEIGGTVQYRGRAAGRTPNPVLIVGAFAYRPDFLDLIMAGGRPVPHAAFYVQSPEFGTAGIAYRLAKLQPFEQGYYVTGVILDEMDETAAPAATGLYPDMSLLVRPPPAGPVMVLAEQTVAGIDFELSDF